MKKSCIILICEDSFTSQARRKQLFIGPAKAKVGPAKVEVGPAKVEVGPAKSKFAYENKP